MIKITTIEQLHCLQHRSEHTHGRPMQHFMVTFVISPSPDECRGWSSRDFAALAKEVIHEIDAVDISRLPGCRKCKSTNFENSMNVSALHRDSRSGILHLHLDVFRLDMDGRTNDLHQIHVRCMKAAEIINRRHGWKQPEQIRENRRQQISDDCLIILRRMLRFNADEYFDELRKTLDCSANERRLMQETHDSISKELDGLKQYVHTEVESAKKELNVKVALDEDSMRLVHKLHDEQREKIGRMLLHENAVYLTGFWLWVCTLVFWIGVMAVGIVAVMWAVVGMRFSNAGPSM